MKRLLLPLLAIAASTMILPISASAEWFADLYLGSVFTQKHDVETGILGVSATKNSARRHLVPHPFV